MKIELSYSVKRWLIDSLVIIGFLELFYLLTGWGFFIFFIFGYISGCVYNSFLQFIREVKKQRAIFDFESAMSNNFKENEVIDNE